VSGRRPRLSPRTAGRRPSPSGGPARARRGRSRPAVSCASPGGGPPPRTPPPPPGTPGPPAGPHPPPPSPSAAATRGAAPAGVRGHGLVAAELVGVRRRAAEHLRPPGGDVRAVRLAHAAGEERRQELVLLDPVVERVDEAAHGVPASGPLVQRREPRLVHTHA